MQNNIERFLVKLESEAREKHNYVCVWGLFIIPNLGVILPVILTTPSKFKVPYSLSLYEIVRKILTDNTKVI